MKKKLKIGWIGSGFVGQVAHLINFTNLDNTEILGLAELRPKLGKAVCQKYNIPNYYNNHKELLKNNELDAIVAIVRRNHTAPLAYEILQKGYNLFTEKPMAQTYDHGKKLVQIAKKNKCIYVIGNMRLHDQGVIIAKNYFDKFIKSKELGEIISFRTFCFAGADYCNIDGDIKTDEPSPTHKIWNTVPKWIPVKMKKNFEKFLTYFVHDISLINFFFNQLPKVNKYIYKKNSGNISFDYKSFYGTFEYGYLNQHRWDEGMEIYFTKGHIRIKLAPAFLRNVPAEVEIYSEKDGKKIISHKSDWTWAFKRQAEDFVNCIIKNKHSHSSGKNSLRDLKVIETSWKTLL